MTQLTQFQHSNPEQATFQSQDFAAIQQVLTEAGVKIERWTATFPIQADTSNEQILAAYQTDIDNLKAEGGYQTVDVISMHPQHPDKDAFRKKFLSEHIHTEDEVRFFVKGKGLFCLHIGDHVYQVLCEQEDLISVPANTPHWFDMGSAPEFTAIRLFNNQEGWVAHFTGDDIANQFPLLD